MIVIEQGGEWLWQKVQNIPNSLKKDASTVSLGSSGAATSQGF
mgnify:CR=1 FL=1